MSRIPSPFDGGNVSALLDWALVILTLVVIGCVIRVLVSLGGPA